MEIGIMKCTHETWEEVMLIRARKWNLAEEVQEGYQKYLAEGKEPHDAAWCALFDWDLLDLIPTKESKVSKPLPRWVPQAEREDERE